MPQIEEGIQALLPKGNGKKKQALLDEFFRLAGCRRKSAAGLPGPKPPPGRNALCLR
jgi:hypothetical protein